MDELNKTQLILLALLVSFVTSIATGIVTVTLMDQAPPAVSQTINRVVEKTIERVVPEKSQPATVVQTVTVEKADIVADIVDERKGALVRITGEHAESGAEGAASSTLEFVATGFLVSSDGLVVTDAAHVAAESVYVAFSGDRRFSAQVVAQDEERGVAVLALQLPEGERTAQHIALPNARTSKLGQDVVALGERTEGRQVKMGLVESLDVRTRTIEPEEEGGEPREESYTHSIVLGNALSGSATGALLLDMESNPLGMVTVRQGAVRAIPASYLEAFVRDARTHMADTAAEDGAEEGPQS